MNAKYILGLLLAVSLMAFKNGDKPEIPSPLTIFPLRPQKGAEIKIIYKPTGKLEGADKVTAVLIYGTGDPFELGLAKDITLIGNKKSGWQATFLLPDSAIAFALRFSADGVDDDRNGQGYVSPVYIGSKPIVGTYSAQGLMYTYGKFLLGLLADRTDTAVQLYEKDFALHPALQNKLAYWYYNALLKARGKEIVYPQIEKAAARLMATPTPSEADFITAVNLYNLQGGTNDNKRDSVLIRGYQKYPSGDFAFDNYIKTMFYKAYRSKQNGLDSSISFHQKFLKQFPFSDPDSYAGKLNATIFSQIRIGLINAGEYDRAINYVDSVHATPRKRGFAKAWTYNFIAGKMLEKKQDPALAEHYGSLAVEGIQKYMFEDYDKYFKPGSTSLSQSKEADLKRGYCWFADNYAQALAVNGKHTKALEVQKKVCGIFQWTKPDYNERYVEYLAKTEDMDQVKNVSADLISKGAATTKIKSLLKEAYIQERGTEVGYDKYLASLEGKMKTAMQKKTLQEVMKLKVNKPAKKFSFSDLNGKTVSLTSLKGKIVILDFWALWCAPCKASFPAMKLAMEKYKADSNVVFVFVNTFERIENNKRIEKINQYLNANDFPFHVILDNQMESNENLFIMANDYKVTGIPAKFIIDGKGIVRFRSGGFETEEKLLEELSIMINEAKD